MPWHCILEEKCPNSEVIEDPRMLIKSVSGQPKNHPN